MNVKTRQINLDILKCIGLMCIILAHVVDNDIIFQLRNFDVVLLILISSKLYFDSDKAINTIKTYILYFWKRFQRLVFPTFIFLTILFGLNMIFRFSDWQVQDILCSYALQGGIGYVWIIRIYLIIAALLPIVDYFNKRVGNEKTLIYNVLLYILYEFFCAFGFFNNKIVVFLFAYIIPCSLLISITDVIRKSSNKKLICMSLLSFLLFLVCGVYLYVYTGRIENTNIMKYPFRTYYLSYALSISIILIVIFRNKKIVEVFYNKVVSFVSANSLWLYLWHILFLQIVPFDNWIINYIFVVVGTFLVVLIQSTMVQFAIKKNVSKNIIKLFQG